MSLPLQSIQNDTSTGRAPLSPPPSPVLSRQDENRAPDPSPATVEPPKKRRKVDADSINSKTDEEVWGFEDTDIIAGVRAKWQSEVYDHFTPSIVRDSSKSPHCMKVILTYKFLNPRHKPMERLRATPGSFNTSNMLSAVRTCIPPGAPLRCACLKRAFNEIEDSWYRMEVQLLRPGTVVPSADTVAEDVQRLYVSLAHEVKKYFLTRARELHSVVDGWTSPIEDQYLGAGILAETLKKYGLAKFLHLLMMDNAGNCNTTATSLVKYIREWLLAAHRKLSIPTFRGTLARGRCFIHIIQLVAKVIMSFVFKQAKRKKTVKAKKGSAKRTTAPTAPVDDDAVEELVVWDDDPSADADDLAMAAEIYEPEDDTAPTAQELYDGKVSNAVRAIAIRDMAARGVTISAAEEKDALKLFPKEDFRPIHTEFMAIINNPATKLSTDHNTTELARRNATRWGSEYNCLRTRRILVPAVDALIADKNLKLGAYKFTGLQKTLALELETVLEALEGPIKHFQNKNRPLIVDVIPEMEDLDFILEAISGASDQANVTRVAAYAGLLVLRKYYALLDDCEAYRIAIVMCPDRKLQWFRERGWDDGKIAGLRSLVVRRFTESYKSSTPSTQTTPASQINASTSSTRTQFPLSGRFHRPTVAFNPATSEADNIHTYLDSPLCEPTSSVIEYWNSRLKPANSSIVATPDLARFGLSFCSCPATSVDAERSFSEGRNQIAWNQKSMSSQAFRAKMASCQAPFFNLDSAVSELGKHRQAHSFSAWRWR
ncbi:putative AC transposase [Favolaschia claudopus]|uniref:AC transposase n=1 Tax=Favolaschia claudopus TaxID=2862362 RepID=A0AAV9Z5X4_9AGAR